MAKHAVCDAINAIPLSRSNAMWVPTHRHQIKRQGGTEKHWDTPTIFNWLRFNRDVALGIVILVVLGPYVIAHLHALIF